MRKLIVVVLVVAMLFLLVNVASSQTISVHVRPKLYGELQPSTTFNYVFNFTSDNLCGNVILSKNAIITTDAYGVGYAEVNISDLTEAPQYLCEYRNGYLRKVHRISDGVTSNLWVRNNANIGGNLDVGGDANVDGNATINLYYGEMWYNNNTGTLIDFTVANTYYTVFFTNYSRLNGVNFTGGFNTNSYLTPTVSGIYKVCFSLAGSGTNNHEYHTTILVNSAEQQNCMEHHKLDATGDILTQSGCCLLELNSGDILQAAVRDYGGTSTGYYYYGSVNIMRIGS